MSPQMLREASPVAHKEHRCDGCSGPVLPGQKYLRTTYIADDLYDWVQCPGCTEDNVSGWVLAGALWDDDGWCWDDAYTWATDTVHDQACPEAERQGGGPLDRARRVRDAGGPTMTNDARLTDLTYPAEAMQQATDEIKRLRALLAAEPTEEDKEGAWGEYRDGPDYQPTDRHGVRAIFDIGWDAALRAAAEARR